MDSKEIIIICLTAILVALIIGGAIVMANSNDNKNPNNKTNVSNNVTADKLSFDNISTDDDDIVSIEIVFNEQQGYGYYKQVNYKDGGFRQFDLDTGDLIGSSYPEDQRYLPSMEWKMIFKITDIIVNQVINWIKK